MPHCLGMCVPTDEYKSTKQLIKLIGVYMKTEISKTDFIAQSKLKTKNATKRMHIVYNIFSNQFDAYGWTLRVGHFYSANHPYIINHENVWFETDSVDELVRWLAIMDTWEYKFADNEKDFHDTVKRALTRIENAKRVLDIDA